MRESLSKLKAAIEHERRLNTSIKEKKVGYDKVLFRHCTPCDKAPREY